MNFMFEGEILKKIEKLSLMLIVFTLTFASICIAKTQIPAENMKTFFDSEIPGIKIQVNATAEAQPTENITVMLSLTRLTNVYVEYFNLSIFGFLNGTDKVLMANITDNNFSLSDTPSEYECPPFKVPEQVWDVTYGEIMLTYNVTYPVGSGILMIPYENLIIGFAMTHVENVYLKGIEEQLKSYEQLNQTFWESFQMNLSTENLAELNRTYWEYKQNYTSLQGTLNELNSARQAAVALAITTIFFVATTVYLVMRKPKQYW